MADSATTQSELLLEAQRTTHAVRAIGRFLILQVTYLVIAGLGIGLALAAGGLAFAGIVVFGGAVTIIVGLFHSIIAGLDELEKSDRSKAMELSATPPLGYLEGSCECSKSERASARIDVHDGVEYCARCKKPSQY